MHSDKHTKEIDKTLPVLFIPLDMIELFGVALFFNLMSNNTHTHRRNRCTKGRGVL